MIENATLQDWEVQIKKYLKDQNIEDSKHEVLAGISFQPFAHLDNTVSVNHPVQAPSQQLIGVSFDKNLSNQILLKALENGGQSLVIELDKTSNLDQLLNNVKLDFITPIFHFKDSESVNKLQLYLDKNYSNGQIQTAFLKGGVLDSEAIVYSLPLVDSKETNIIKELVDICQQVIDLKPLRIGIEVCIGQQFFVEIAKLRALRICLSNIDRDLSISITPTIITHLDPNLYNGDPHNTMIHQTCAALSALIGNTDIVCLKPWQEDHNHESRISIHIQNILHLESNLSSYQDAMGGSYFIEDLTQQIASKVWENLDY